MIAPSRKRFPIVRADRHPIAREQELFIRITADIDDALVMQLVVTTTDQRKVPGAVVDAVRLMLHVMNIETSRFLLRGSRRVAEDLFEVLERMHIAERSPAVLLLGASQPAGFFGVETRSPFGEAP